MSTDAGQVRRLLLVLGDQLNRDSALFDGADPAQDLVWMCEAPGEATHVPSHKARTVLFLAAMRHCRDALRADGWRVRYLALDDHEHAELDAALEADLRLLAPARVEVVQPGEHRVLAGIERAAAAAGVPLAVLEDRHFLCSIGDFDRWAKGRRELRLEYFYRFLRKRHDLLMDDGGPVGGAWNFDKDNRRSFGKRGPGLVPRPAGFPPDATTRAVMALVERRFPDAPGRLDDFDWPVTPEQAAAALAIRTRSGAASPISITPACRRR